MLRGKKYMKWKGGEIMRKMYIAVLMIMIILTGCNPLKRIGDGEDTSGLKKLEETEKFQNINGFKAEKGKFYFSGIQEENLGFFSINLRNHEIEKEDWDIAEYDLYIPLENQESIIVNFDGELIHRRNNQDTKIDTEISGEYSPNILLSPNRKQLIYTKGPREGATLCGYNLTEGEKIKIKDKITDEAFYTFHYTTQWSNSSNYFLHNNDEIYDIEGNLYDKIEGTTAKWSPNDDYIAYIEMPKDKEKQKIQIGDWISYIGTNFSIFDIQGKNATVIFKNSGGLIDPVDSIQWSRDSSRVSISEGKIIKSTGGELEEIQYDRVLVYGIEDKKKYEVKDMRYNHYEFIFNNMLYGNNFGMREALEIIDIETGKRKSYAKPIMLNSKELFMISHGDRGYFVNGKELLQITKDGKVSTLINLPWNIDEMYIDTDTEQLIVINEKMELYLIKLKNN